MTSHAGHDHAATPAARAACRAAGELPQGVAKLVEQANRYGLTVVDTRHEARSFRAVGHLDIFNPADPAPTHIWVNWITSDMSGRTMIRVHVYHSSTCHTVTCATRKAWAWMHTLSMIPTN